MTKPKKIRLTNNQLSIISFFKEWCDRHFPHNKGFVLILVPSNIKINIENFKKIDSKVGLVDIETQIWHTQKQSKICYRYCINSSVIITLLLSMEKDIKKMVEQNQDLARAYIRGLMAREGTAYNNKMQYVRIEMKNKKEILFIEKLLKMMKYNVTAKERGTRKDMWYIYIGAKNLKKFYDEIGFGSATKRQTILEEIIQERLEKGLT